MKFLLLCCAFLPTLAGLKFLSYTTVFGSSHLNFMHALHEALIDAGHEVHVIAPIIDSRLKMQKTRAKVIFIPQSPESIEFELGIEEEMVANAWLSEGIINALEPMMRILPAWHGQCNATLQHPGLLEKLSRDHYDAAFSEPICYCGFGIFERLGIENIASTLSISSSEGFFRYTGAPSVPSYVPGVLSGFTDRMSFMERVSNTLQTALLNIVTPMLLDPYSEMFKLHYGKEFATVQDIMTKASLHFLNAAPVIEFPRPITQKIIDIGGITVAEGLKPLNETWSNILGLRNRTVLISFGTIAKSYLMPEKYKETIRETVRKMPDVTFIWKYEKPEDRVSDGISNLIESTWFPQNDLLQDPRLSLFITHCGLGSIIESTRAGVPLIGIPVLGDHDRNAQTIKRIETGIVLDKSILAGGDTLEKTIKEVLMNEKYDRKAKRIGKMIRSRPFSAHETFVRNMEYMANFGPLRHLDHYGTQLNLFQYYCLDVFAFLLLIALLTFGPLCWCITKLLRSWFLVCKKSVYVRVRKNEF